MLKILGLCKVFNTNTINENKVFDNFNVDIKKGEFVTIIGSNGAGKSTLLRCINGLEDYRDGSLTVEGQEVKDLTEKEIRELRKNLGMIFQHFSLLERKTVFENVALPLECFKYSKAEIEKRVMNLLELVGLADKRDAKPRNLSGGQKQRVAIARAIAKNPKLLLCDEPTGALDYNTGKAILKLLQETCRKNGVTVVIITHNLALTPMGDKVIEVKNGRIKNITINKNPVPVERIEW